jgi:hypothetical protein
MLVNVYHIDDDLFEEDMELYRELTFGDFDGDPSTIKENASLVARIEVDSLEAAFEMTQNGVLPGIDSWEEGPHVDRLYEENNRSTKVGDMIEVINEPNAPDGYYFVDSYGFKEL